MSGQRQLFYLSFAKDEGRGGWQGFCIVEATSEFDAIMTTHRKNINPGGAVVTFDTTPFADRITDEWLDKLFNTEDDVVAFDRALGGEGTIDKRML